MLEINITQIHNHAHSFEQNEPLVKIPQEIQTISQQQKQNSFQFDIRSIPDETLTENLI